MKISIAMATYNGAKYLHDQLASFCNQTRRPDELIVTDDNSRDETLEILEDFAAKAPFEVHVRCNETNIGYAQNFSRAMTLCTGDLIFLSDQDDIWFPIKIEIVEKIVQSSDNLVFLNDASIVDDDLTSLGNTKFEQIRASGYIPETYHVMGCTMAIKRDMLDIALPIPPNFRAHDAWIAKIAEAMGRKEMIQRTLQYYRRHDQNVSHGITSRTKRTGVLGTLMHKALAQFKSEYISIEDVAKQWDILVDAVNIKANTGSQKFAYEINECLEILQRERNIIWERARIRSRSRPQRILPVCRLWTNGGYDYFSGFQSILRDLFFK